MEIHRPAQADVAPTPSPGVVVLRTQGGLGNQLFQLLYARLLAQKLGVALHEVHETQHREEHPRYSPPAAHPPPSGMQLRISSWRVPRLVRVVLGRGFERPLRLGKDWYLDGHFQMGKQYMPFDEQAKRQQLLQLATELDIAPASLDQCLVVMQPGDFFGNIQAARLHALTRLSACPEGASLMTSGEELLQDQRLCELMTARRGQLISTQDLSPVEVLRTMSRYKHLDTENGSLAVWCRLLSGSQVQLPEPRLSELACHLGAFAPWR
jgi:hypothetical protein